MGQSFESGGLPTLADVDGRLGYGLRETAKVIVKRNEDLLARDALGGLFFRVAQRQVVRPHAVDLGRERKSRIVDTFFQILEGAVAAVVFVSSHEL